MENELQFNSVFLEYKPLACSIAKRYSRSSGVPVEELISQLSEEVWIAYTKFREDRGATLNTWMNTRLRDRAVRVVSRREGIHYSKTVCIADYVKDDQDDSDAPTFEIKDEGCDVEVLAIDNVQKKEADQLQLISSLVNDPSQVDPETKLIVSEFEKYDSITALSKALGMHHEFVKRKLRRLSRLYDANRFGDIYDHIAV